MRTGVLVAVVIGASIAGNPQAAQNASPEPAPVTLTLRIGDGRRHFRPGDVIPIELEFSSAIPKRFVVDGATYDRSGRLTVDQFRIEPIDAVIDPLLDYLAAAGGFIGGGIRGMGVLGDASYTVRLELNDWFRFADPGTYRLSVLSRRVTDEIQKREGSSVTVPVQSNAVSFEILPREAAWESSRLAEALQILGSNRPEIDRRRGCRLLRFLATDAAVDEMIRRYDTSQAGCEFEYMAGLFAAPNRERVVAQMEARLAAGDQAVTPGYLRTVAVLSMYVRHPEFRPPQVPEAKGGFPRPDEYARRQDAIAAAESGYLDELAEALPHKTGRARAVAALTLAARGRGDGGRDVVARTFLELPSERQRTLLLYEWGRISSPHMLPSLRAIARGGAGESPEVGDLALRRLFELAPDEGRPLILAGVSDPQPGATLQTLGMLPDRELPQLDDVLARNIEPEGEHDALSIRAELLHRYASSALSARVHSRIAPLLSDMACRPKAALLAYFLRADPQLGAMLLDDALEARTTTGCYRMLLRSIAPLRKTPALEAAALAHIDDPDAELAANAIATLGEFGSPAARDPLRSRFERWHQQWKGRSGDFEYSYAEKRPHVAQGAVEFALFSALAKASAWITGPEELRELHAWCVSEYCRSQVGYLIDAARDPVVRVFRLDDSDDCSCSVGQYDLQSLKALEQKLSQYPPGTSLGLDLSALGPKSAAIVSDRIRQIAARQGLAIR